MDRSVDRHASAAGSLLVFLLLAPVAADEQPPPDLRPWLRDAQAWERDAEGPVVALGEAGAFDDTHIFAPAVAYDGERFRLWYCGSRGAVDERVFRLGFATSRDGRRFERRAEPVFELPDGARSVLTPALLRRADGAALREEGRLRMWFSAAALQGGAGFHTLHESSSADGVHWSAPSAAQLENAYAPCVLKIDGRYQMWFTGVASDPWQLRFAESRDGRTWQVRPEPCLVVDQAWERQRLFYPTVVRVGRVYLMWYGSYWSERDNTTALGFAASLDGRRWYKHPRNPVLRPDPARSWESHYVTSQSVLRLADGSFRIWYASRKAPPFVNKYFAISTARWRPADQPRAAAFVAREMNPPSDGAEAPPAPPALAIVGARLVDGHGGAPVEDAVVVVRGTKIAAAGARAAVAIPEDAERIDAAGRTVLPGLIDTHLHTANEVETPARFLAHGVTSFRDPGHPFRFYAAVGQAERPLPRVFLCGGHFDGTPPIWPDQAVVVTDAGAARRAVHRHVDRGASAIKIYFRLPLALYPAVLDAAAERGVPVTAHLELVDADDAIRAGVHGVEHVTSFGTALADPHDAAEFKRRVSEDPSRRRELRYELWAKLDLESPRAAALLDLLVERRVVVSPTLGVFERRRGDDGATEVHARAFESMLRFTGMCHARGVPVVVGSHTSVPHARRGEAYQRELELLVEAGLTPLEAISAGTLGGARFLGIEARLGSIEPGKAADIVLVDGDPSRDIRAMYDVRRVLLNGVSVRAE